MAIRQIRKYGDEILRKKAKEVAEINTRVVELIEDMVETLNSSETGIGLAAPQVGVLKRIIVMKTGEEVLRLINPVITAQAGEQIEIEGCLSIPEKYGTVKRPAEVTVEGLNEKGEKVQVKGTELVARLLCHEIDHLDGILFIDKVINYVDPKGMRNDD